MQELAYLIITNGDFVTADKLPVSDRVPFFETVKPGVRDSYEAAMSSKPPRLVKTHLASSFYKKTLQNKKTKFVVVMRNPKDTIVSFFHMYRMFQSFGPFTGSWDDYFKMFQDNQLIYGNQFEVTVSWWKLREDPRVLIVKYEDMVKDVKNVIRKVACYLGKQISNELVTKIAERTAFDSMRKNPSLNYENWPGMDHSISPFIRKGKVGDWKNYFSEEQSDYVDSMCSKYYAPLNLLLEEI